MWAEFWVGREVGRRVTGVTFCEPVKELGPRAGGVVIGEVCQPALPGGDHPVQENTCYARLGRTTQSLAEDFMARRRRKGKGSRTAQPNVMHPDAWLG